MKVIDVFEYKRAREKRDKLKHLLTELDSVGDILYNNLEYSAMWKLIQELETIRVQYYVEFYEWDQIVKRGKQNVEK